MIKSPDEASTPSLRGLIDALIDQKLQTVQGPMPGKVTSYDATKQRASVQPLVQRVFYDEVGTRTTQLRPIVQDVPILFAGGGGTRITTGLAAGDTVLLIPCGPSISRWVVRGGEVDPGEDKGSLADCIALAGLHDFAHVPTTAPAGAIVLHSSDIRLGSAFAFESALLGDSFQTALDILLTAISAYIVAIQAVADPGNVATPVLSTAITAFLSTWATRLSTSVKLE